MPLKQSHETFIFIKIANKYSSNIKRHICKDQYVGNINVNNIITSNPVSNSSNDDFDSRVYMKDFQRTNSPIIILILESPHNNEFKSKTPKPAAGNSAGSTGKGIRQLFYDACQVHNHLGNGNYNLVIINAIQYQCSLGEIPSKYRDKVFADCWYFFGKNNFKKRLISLYKNGDVIINACTAGKKTPKIRNLVQEAINQSVGSTTIEVEHPSNWQLRKNEAGNGIADYSWRS